MLEGVTIVYVGMGLIFYHLTFSCGFVMQLFPSNPSDFCFKLLYLTLTFLDIMPYTQVDNSLE